MFLTDVPKRDNTGTKMWLTSPEPRSTAEGSARAAFKRLRATV